MFAKLQASRDIKTAKPGKNRSPIDYRKIDPTRFEIRLCHILSVPESEGEDATIYCQLVHTSLLEAPRYSALSYCWGEVASRTRLIHVDMRRLPVTSSMVAALEELRRRRIDYVWIDFICINQEDEDEKGRQVLLMDRIFSHAINVYAWLGPSPPFADSVLSILSDCAKGNSLGQGLSDSVRTLLRALFGNLYGNPYWKRVWIIQELAKAQSVVFLWGCFVLHWDMLMDAKESADFQDLIPEEPLVVLSALQEFRSRELRSNTRPQRHSLLEALVQSRRSLATDGRDKIFALLNLTADGRDIIPFPNYTQSMWDIYLEAAHGIMVRQKKMATILLARFKGPHLREDGPSWAVDWSSLATHTIPEWILSALNVMENEPALPASVLRTGTRLQVPYKPCTRLVSFLDNFSLSPLRKWSSTYFIVELFDVLTWGRYDLDRQALMVHYDYHSAYYLPEQSWKLFTFASLALREENCPPPLVRFMSTHGNSKINGKSIAEHLRSFLEMIRSSGEPQQSVEEVSEDVVEGIGRLSENGMRLATTDDVHIRAVFDAAQPQDEICYLPNCPLPVLLRRVGIKDGRKYYSFVGEVYMKPGVVRDELRDCNWESTITIV